MKLIDGTFEMTANKTDHFLEFARTNQLKARIHIIQMY